MARKKKEPEMPQAPAKPATKPVRLDLPAELHQKLRVVAALNGKSMADFARGVVEAEVRRVYAEVQPPAPRGRSGE